MLEVTDRFRPPVARGDGRVLMRLNAGFEVRALEGARIERHSPGPRVQELMLRLTGEPEGVVTLTYSGSPVVARVGEGPSEWYSARGAHLGAGSAWYPRLQGALHSFDLTVHAPADWQVLAPGRPATPAAGATARWISERPVEDIDLVAGPLRTFVRDEAWGTAAVWLRSDDRALADTYLDAVARYVPFYARLIGGYPYSRFTVVENLRPTGWGMPAFTLLGGRVMRLPFIPHTSLPHEVLHNWWGNGVLVDFSEGNWSEGLTAYLADHLLAERRGRGARHRRNALARFRSAAGEGADTAPVTFLSRHGRRSQSVGYDKPLMIFHMARRAVGDTAFVERLRTLYRSGLGRRVGAREVLDTLTPQGEDWFEAWWQRTGAPRLELTCCEVTPTADGVRVVGSLRQSQTGEAFPLRAPVRVLVEGEAIAREHPVIMRSKSARFEITLPAAPLALEVDGGFELMRIPATDELPPALGEMLDAVDAVAVLAPGLPPELADAYRRIATQLGARLVEDAAANDTQALWIFGRDARAASALAGELDRRVPEGDTRVMVARGADERIVVLVDAQSPAGVTAMARKLRHYGRYGLLGFSGARARNVFKGENPVEGSPLRVDFEPALRGQALPLVRRDALAP